MKSRFSLWVIIFVTVIAVSIDIPTFIPTLPSIKVFNKKVTWPNFPLKLGLDLQGGTELVLETQMDKIDPKDRDTALESARKVIERRVNPQGVSEAVVQSSKLGNNRRILVELPGVKDASQAASLVGRRAHLDFRELVELSGSADASSSATFKQTNLTGADLKRASVTFGSSGKQTGPQISIEFNEEGTRKFAEITKRNVGKPVAIFLDNELVSAPSVQQEIIGGNAVITGQFTAEEAKNLAIQLNAGALPVPIKILQQQSIGPTLGAQSISKSLTAGIIGLGIVAIYMIAFYGVLGFIADIALIIYTLVMLAIFKTGLFILPPVTLTLAGIAGFILSIGMAVDANILIFERMKEEIRWGKSKSLALDIGFKRAWSSIWASNVSSLTTVAILYGLGTSLIKGFALTLAIGILVSMFTSYIVTRTILRVVTSL